MRKILSFLLLSLFVNLSFAQITETVTTGASYVDEVYYSFESGSVKTVARDTWDMAFTTNTYDVSILVNNGNGTELYTYQNGDISNWEDVDTTGLGTWTPMYNSIESWYGGAFVINSSGHPDYGWGVYNEVTHKITGDSIFIMKLASGTYKKVWIVEKNSPLNEWEFKHANIDGTDEVTVNFNANGYTDMNFIHYSIEENEFVEQEANADEWQLLFTRYYDYKIPYFVSGVLAKDGVFVQEIRKSGLNQAECYDFNNEELSNVIKTIGSDWKAYYFKGWEVADTVVYFVQDSTAIEKTVWKLYFTDFGGMGNGEYTFIKEAPEGMKIDKVNKTFTTVYPNPVENTVNLIYDIDGSCVLSIYNISGQIVYKENINHNEHLNKHQINVENLPAGFYNIILRGEQISSSTKFIKNK